MKKSIDLNRMKEDERVGYCNFNATIKETSIMECLTYVKGESMMKKVFMKLTLFAAAAVLALAPAASAVSWTGGGDGESWNDADNWEDNDIPTSDDSFDFTHDGTVTIENGAAAARNFTIQSDDFIFNIQDDFDVRFSDGWGDGTNSNVGVNHSAGDVYFEYDLVLGTNGGRADYNMTGGSLTWDRDLFVKNAGFDYRGGSLGDGNENVTVSNGGRLTKFGEAPVPSDRTNHIEGLVTDNGSFRATIDKTGFDPLKVQYLRRLDATNDSLEVGLDGGIMLNANSQFDVVEISNALSGTDVGAWGNTPTMWNEETTDDHVRVTLDEDFDRGSLDAATVGSSIDERDDIHGFVGLENIDQIELLQLGLNLDDTSAENTNISAFMDDLTDAGYDVSEISGYDLGLTFSDLGTDDLHFAWDLSAYDNSELTLTEITVIPEPSTLVLLGLAGLLLMKRRRL